LNKSLTLCLAVVGMQFSAAIAYAAEPETCQIVRIADGGYSDNVAQNGLVAAVIENLGYKAEVQLLAIPVVLETLKNGQMDVFLDAWSPAIDPQTKPYIDAKQVSRVKTTLTDAKYTLAVPAYAYDAGLKSFADIHKFKDQLDGKLYGLEPGNDSNVNIGKMIAEDDFGLGQFELVESSEQAVLSQLRKAVRKGEWMVFPAWSPHPMNAEFEIRYLEGGDKYYGPNLGAAEVYTITRNDYVKDCPNIGKFFENLDFTSAMESEVMQQIEGGVDFKEAGRKHLTANPEPLSRWLKGVTTTAGEPAEAAVLSAFGISK
jgi:glycine betaine/proline transport system substrate-binding protein